MTKNYWNLPGISNSELKRFETYLDVGEWPARTSTSRAMMVGTEFHRLVLEPHLEPENMLTNAEIKRANKLGDVANASSIVSWYKANKDLEIESIQVKHMNVGGKHVRFKGKLDLLIPFICAGDLKSTRAKSVEEFFQLCREYRYFRQAWIYMELSGVKDFHFIGTNELQTFVINCGDFPKEMEKAETEVNWLVEQMDKHSLLSKYK